MRLFRGVLLFFLLAALPTRAQSPDGVPQVLASIRPVHSIAAAVMAGAGTPDLLIAGGASPHAYALRPSDAAKLARAEIVFWIGPALETFLEAPLESLAPDAATIALMDADGLTRLPVRQGGLWEDEQGEEPGPTDAHVWLDPRNGAAMAWTMAEALAAADPGRARLYRNNAGALAARLEAQEAVLRSRLAGIAGRPYVVFHDAYQYFEARYALSPLGSVSVAADRPVGMGRVLAVRARIRQTPAICVFAPPQFSPALLTALTEGADARRAILDDLGTELEPGPALYEALMVRLADAFFSCLGG